ncbi:MAG: cobalamin-dependent protein [Candidatus Desulfatibia sp.]|uniref:cobalamin B12-binding domain-containing protein n=1 Tax=Candidatus Desulfatibia sp. TaxID=3101189 RepID=UPI002F2FBB1B
MGSPVESKKIRVVLAKSDMDAHDRGVRYLAKVFRDQGMEVIFIRYRIVDEVVAIAQQEDATVIGLSFYGSGLMYDTSRALDLLREKQMTDVLVILGGTIHEDAAADLKRKGLKGVFTPGTPIEDIITFVKENVRKR